MILCRDVFGWSPVATGIPGRAWRVLHHLLICGHENDGVACRLCETKTFEIETSIRDIAKHLLTFVWESAHASKHEVYCIHWCVVSKIEGTRMKNGVNGPVVVA